MNCLYISKLNGDLSKGPNNSVPAQIAAQSKFDNVMWYNLSKAGREEWKKLHYYRDLNDIPSNRISDLPQPFCHPDIVIFEGLFEYPFCPFLKEIQEQHIPYIIIPRSAMTLQAQKRKPLKKLIGKICFFGKFVSQAAAIHYLTEEELKQSFALWKQSNYFIIPNGINEVREIRNKAYVENIKATYIGRIEPYQKGIDLLLESVNDMQHSLRNIGFCLVLYGPDIDCSVSGLKEKIELYGIEDIVSFSDSIFGEKKDEVLRNSDIFIMTSRFEGMPMGLIEALAYGIPCVVTKGTNLADEISKYNAGWVAENEVDSIKIALKNMINERDSFILKSQNAVMLSKMYSWDRIAEKSHRSYLKIVNS